MCCGVWDFGKSESDVTTVMPRQFLKFSLGIDRIWDGKLIREEVSVLLVDIPIPELDITTTRIYFL
jgi:hypothetical protein